MLSVVNVRASLELLYPHFAVWLSVKNLSVMFELWKSQRCPLVGILTERRTYKCCSERQLL